MKFSNNLNFKKILKILDDKFKRLFETFYYKIKKFNKKDIKIHLRPSVKVFIRKFTNFLYIV